MRLPPRFPLRLPLRLPPRFALPLPAAALAVGLLTVAPPAAAATGCVVLPTGECADEAPRLMGGWVADHRLGDGTRVVVVPAPTPGRISIELRLDLPWQERAVEDVLVARLLAWDRADAAHQRSDLGAATTLERGHGALILRTDGPATALGELLFLEGGRLERFAPTPEQIAAAALVESREARRRAADPDVRLLALARGEAPADGPPPSQTAVEARFSDTWRSGAATVVVAGDVDVDEVSTTIAELWDRLDGVPDAVAPEASGSVGLPRATSAPPLAMAPGPRRVEAHSSRAARARVAVAWPVPASLDGTRRAAATELVRELLVGPGTPLLRSLQDEALRVWSPSSEGALVVAVELEPGADAASVEARILAAAAALAGASLADLDTAVARARDHLVAAATVELQDAHGWAHAAGRVMATGAPPEGVDRRVDVLRVLASQHVSEAARAVLDPDRARVALLLPFSGVDPAGVDPAGVDPVPVEKP